VRGFRCDVGIDSSYPLLQYLVPTLLLPFCNLFLFPFYESFPETFVDGGTCHSSQQTSTVLQITSPLRIPRKGFFKVRPRAAILGLVDQGDRPVLPDEFLVLFFGFFFADLPPVHLFKSANYWAAPSHFRWCLRNQISFGPLPSPLYPARTFLTSPFKFLSQPPRGTSFFPWGVF